MLRILVAEDDLNTRKLMCAVLKQNGFLPIPAENGLNALEIAASEHIDFAIIDIMMPEMDGYELTKELRADFKHLPILMVTAKEEPKDKHQGFIAGTDDYMVKPVDEQEMILRIRALLRRSQIVSEQKIVIGNVVLDYNTFIVSGYGQSVQLPQKEFLLLFKLLSYPGKIFTRLQLMEEVWGIESDVSDHTLNVHISRLRDRFYEWKEFDIITIRGLGYKAVKNL